MSNIKKQQGKMGLFGLIILGAIVWFVFQYFQDKGSSARDDACRRKGGVPMIAENNKFLCEIPNKQGTE